MGQPVSGKDGRVTVNGSIMFLEEWSWKSTGKDIPANDFESDGYVQRIGGLREAEIHCKGYWDVDNNPHDTPPAIIPGDIIGPIVCFVSKTLSLSYEADEVLVTEINATNNVDDDAKFDFVCKTTGAFTLPGGIDGNS